MSEGTIELNDFPQNILDNIASFLDTEDKCSLACVNKALLSAVRSTWTTLKIKYNKEEEMIHFDPPPEGLKYWRNLQTILISDERNSKSLKSSSTEDFGRLSFEPESEFNGCFFILDQLNQILYKPKRKLKLVVRVDGAMESQQFGSILKLTSPVSRTPSLPPRDQKHKANKQAFEIANTATESFVHAMVGSVHSSSTPSKKVEAAALYYTTKMAAANQYLSDLGLDPKLFIALKREYVDSLLTSKLFEMTKQKHESESKKKDSDYYDDYYDDDYYGFYSEEVQSDSDDECDCPACSNADVIYRGVVEEVGKYVEEMVKKGEKMVRHDVVNMYSDIDAGWFVPDGDLTDQIVAGSVGWCDHIQPEKMQLKKYKNLESLHISIRECHSFDLPQSFDKAILSQLTPTHLPKLRHLHIRKPPIECLPLESMPSFLNLTQLTSIQLRCGDFFRSFKIFTNFPNLQTLDVMLCRCAIQSRYNPQDLYALASLKSLRELKVEFWHVDENQRIDSLSQLTSLQVTNVHGNTKMLCPQSPMPNLKDFALTDMPFTSTKRYKEDSELARWGLYKSPQFFPNAEVLHVGSLGSGPATIQHRIDLTRAAEVIDGHVRDTLKNACHLKYLQLDVVMHFKNQKVMDRCLRGGVQLDGSVVVDGVEWQRSVVFTMVMQSRVLMAEFHYTV